MSLQAHTKQKASEQPAMTSIDGTSLSDADILMIANSMYPERDSDLLALERTESLGDPAPALGLTPDKKRQSPPKQAKLPKLMITRPGTPATKKRPAVPRKRVAETNTGTETALEKARRMSAMLRNVSPTELQAIDNLKTLADIPAPSALLLKNGQVVDNGFGKAVHAEFLSSSSPNESQQDRLILPARFFPSAGVGDVLPTHVVVYLGQKDLPRDRKCYDLYKVDIGEDETAESVYDNLAAMSEEELAKRGKISCFADFPPNSVFTCTKIKTQPVVANGEERSVHIMTYESMLGGKLTQGEMFVPERCAAEAEGKLPVVMLYRGEKLSKKTRRKYYDVRVMDTARLEQLLNKS